MLDPVLNHHFNNFKTSFEIDTSKPDDKNFESSAFEKFVNYILFSLDYPDIFTANLDLLDFVCVGGESDTGIDGIGVKINERLVGSIEEVQKLAETNRKLNIDFVFIQSKMRPNFNLGEFNKFGLGVKNFFSKGYLPENEKVKEIREIKDFIYSDQKVISKLDRNPSLLLFYVTTGIEPSNDDNFIGSKKILNSELYNGEFFFDKIDIQGVGGKQVIKYCRELENKFEIQLNIVDIFPLIVDLEKEINKAYSFTCNAAEFLKILTKEDGTIRRSLFNDNVRDYMGKGPVNSEIESTIINSPEMFLICNNGVTVVCSDFEQIRDKLVKIENPQIVNGCQTSYSIFNLKEHPNIDKVQILVRLISTEQSEITNKIVKGTNKQNQVLDEAFETILPYHQETLEPFFLTYDDKIKIYYERRSRQYNNDPLIKKTQIVNLRILTQTFVAIFLEQIFEAHRHEKILLEKYAGDEDIRKIFKNSHSPYTYYICAAIWYVFEKMFRENKIDKRYKAYKAHFYLLFRYSIGKFPPRFESSKKMKKYCEEILINLREELFSKKLPLIVEIFDKVSKRWTQSGKSRFGIKESKDFADLLIKEARREFIGNGEPTADQKVDSTLNKGEILNIIWRHGLWFGFIRRGENKENIYFDSRGFDGNIDQLTPYTIVTYKTSKSIKGEYAYNVEMII
ncbi:MAG: AIPR family protein [Desulfobacterales bacterium]|nr:AIPR family protein [Desulfobacterales bacterium]